MTVAAIGHGVKLQRASDASPAVFTTVGEILEINGPTFSKDAVEATHTESPGRFREFISGLRDGGEITATIALDPDSADGSSHKEMVDDWKSDDAHQYRMLFPDGDTYWLFDALVTNLTHATPIDDRMTMETTFKISGEPILDSIA